MHSRYHFLPHLRPVLHKAELIFIVAHFRVGSESPFKLERENIGKTVSPVFPTLFGVTLPPNEFE